MDKYDETTKEIKELKRHITSMEARVSKLEEMMKKERPYEEECDLLEACGKLQIGDRIYVKSYDRGGIEYSPYYYVRSLMGVTHNGDKYDVVIEEKPEKTSNSIPGFHLQHKLILQNMDVCEHKIVICYD